MLTDSLPSVNHNIMTSPHQQPPDVFASYNNNNGQQQQQQAPVIQQQQVQQPPVVQQQQQYQPQAAMAPAPMMQAPPVPMQTAPPQPMMQAPPTQQQPVLQQPPTQQQQQPPQEQQTPPPAVVVTNNAIGNDSPVSQLGDVSVIAASANNVTGPAMPNVAAPSSQPLQPQMPASQPAPVVQQPVVAANPFDSFPAVASTLPTPAQPTTQPPVAPSMAPPPAMAPPQAPPSPPADATQPVSTQQVQQVVQQTLSPPMSPVNLAPQQQAYADPFGFTFSPLTSPVTSPGGSPSGSPGAMVQSTSVNSDPFGVFGGNNKPPTPPQMTANNATVSASVDPFGAGALVPSAQAPTPVANGSVSDPFGIFGSGQPSQPAVAQPEPAQTGHMFSPPALAPQEAEDPWAAAGFGQSTSSSQPEATSQPSLDAAPAYNQQNTSLTGGKQEDKPITLDSNNLPSEGEYYEARINAHSLGAMFFTARNLEDTLFTKLANNIIEALGSRPVVSYVAEGSAANNAGVHLGHVILSVNGQDIQDPEQCANVIRNAPRPMNIRCYIPPDLELTLNEGRHLVKYDTKGATAPASGVEWKRKYVVMGGIVSKPYMMNMFYRKVRSRLFFDLIMTSLLHTTQLTLYIHTSTFNNHRKTTISPSRRHTLVARSPSRSSSLISVVHASSFKTRMASPTMSITKLNV